jgi:pyruvate/2-oxoglutarate/acetoin dehydrogenase E1 component
VEKATEFAFASPEPPASELYKDVYVPLKHTAADIQTEAALRERMRKDATMRKTTYWQALNEALKEEMVRDDKVFIFGEDVGLYGGAYGVTRGLFEQFGCKRVIDTPISEATIAGAATGAAMTGMRPVAEIMYVDFTPLAMDQLANQAAKNRYMFGGKTMVPLTMRTEGGTGRGIAAHHSQSLEALWIHFPGIYVVMPSTPYDAKGLLKTCIRDDNPVLFIEHKMLYGEQGAVPEEEYMIPLGVADIKRAGKDVTVIAYSRMVKVALEAADALAKEGVEVEVVDPRTLKPLDMDTIVTSVKKTGRVVCLTEAYRTGSFAAEVASRIQEQAFDWLDAPVRVLGAADCPVPMAASLESASVPRAADVIAAIREVLA